MKVQAVKKEYLEVAHGLNLGQIVKKAGAFLQKILGSEVAFALVRRENRRSAILEANSGFLPELNFISDEALALLVKRQYTCSPNFAKEKAYQHLPQNTTLYYFPLTETTELLAGLVVVSPYRLSEQVQSDLESFLEVLRPALSNAAEYGKLVREYTMLDTIKQSFGQVWVEVESQQKAIERMLAHNQALLDIGLAINSSLDLKDVLTTIVSEAVKMLDATRGAIAIWRDDIKDLRILAEHTAPKSEPRFTEMDFSNDEPVGIGESGFMKINFPDDWDEEAIRRLHRFLREEWDITRETQGTTLVSPIRWQKQTLAMLIINDLTFGRAFSKEDQNILTLIASQAAVAIENARLFNDMAGARNRTNAILNSIADGVFTTDLDQHITSMNPAAEQISGKFAPDVHGKFYLSAFNITNKEGKSLSVEDSPCYQVIRNHTSLEPRVFQLQTDTGNILISLVAAPIIDNDGVISGVVGVFRDVTREQETNRIKDEFVSLVSHELRTPMASVLGFSELMLTRKLSEEKSRLYIETIHKEAQRLSNLISDFLDIQRMEAGRQIYNFSEVALNDLLIPVLRVFANYRNQITTDIPPNLPHIWADPDRIVQTLTNLIGNAVKYSPNGGKIEVSAVLNEGGMIEIAVKDNGLGIPKDAQPKLFSKFFRVDNSDRREIGGTGLGLAICREIIEAHDGKIWVESELGKGSSFIFTLPAVAEAAEFAEIEESSRAVTPRDTEDEGLILLVEDDTSLGQLIGTYLEEGGYQYEMVESGENAILFLKDIIPDAIVLDIGLAGRMDGWDLLIYLKNQPEYKDIPVIINSVLDNKVKGMTLGRAEYLAKPVDTRRLIETINRLTAQRPQRNVLVIDDDASLRRMIKETLTLQDFVVATAAGGEQGLKLANLTPPDVIVLDLMMPKMDGFQVLSRLRNNRRTINIPVIVITAKELSNQEREFLREDLAYFITKNEYTPQRIRELVRESLAIKHNY
jgi:PAS domain S-box-containing protein